MGLKFKYIQLIYTLFFLFESIQVC
uniref:Uncharacterized protein n=1 Tax=Arundo donax TaxID=35708 RepID=A0A0A9GLF9_ARUDO